MNERKFPANFGTSELEELLATEAEDRIDAYERGEMRSVPAKEVFAEIARKRPK